MNRRSFKSKKQNRFGMFLVTLVVLMLLLVVSIDCIRLKEKQVTYQAKLEELQAEITQTNAYIEEVAKDKLGLVYPDEIVFKIKR